VSHDSASASPLRSPVAAIIAVGEGYESKATSKNGIASAQKNGADAAVVDSRSGGRCRVARLYTLT
jgi:hypothetical protein